MSQQPQSNRQPVAPPAGLAQTLITDRHIATLATMRPDGSIHLAAIWFLYKD